MKTGPDKGVWARAVSYGEVTRKIRICSARFVYGGFRQHCLPIPGVRNVSFLLVCVGRASFMWEFISCFQDEKGRSDVCDDFQVSLTQNNPVPKGHILGWHILPPLSSMTATEVKKHNSG